jgi:hypothetical protein
MLFGRGGEEPANAMGLPTRGFPQLGKSGTARLRQQVENLSAFGSGAQRSNQTAFAAGAGFLAALVAFCLPPCAVSLTLDAFCLREGFSFAVAAAASDFAISRALIMIGVLFCAGSAHDDSSLCGGGKAREK